MPDPISIRSLRETQRRVREIGAYGGFVVEGTPPETTELHLVRWNRAASSSTSLFPGYRYLFEAETDTKTNVETVWLRTLTGGPPGDCYFWAKLTGQHSDGVLIYTPIAPLKFKAKLTSRTAVSCGSSGSTGTAHTVYEYGFIGVKLILDGDGCPAWVDTELGPDISGTAFEKNNRKVATGTIVDIEVVFRQDLSASGSGDGIASGDSCVYLFDAPADSTAIETTTELACLGGNLHQVIKRGGVVINATNFCVPCGCSGSAGGCQNCGSQITSPICLTLPSTISAGCPWPSQITCDYAFASGGAEYWIGSALGGNEPSGPFQPGGQSLWRAVVSLVCGRLWSVLVDRSSAWEAGGYNPSGCGFESVPGTTGAFCSVPVTIGNLVLTGVLPPAFPITGTLGSATVSEGHCPGTSGSGVGGCPCSWECRSLIWSELTGNPLCTGTPAFGQGRSCDLGNEGQVVYTNTDGTACTPGGGSGTPGCGDCGTANRTATPSGATGFLTALTTQTLVNNGGIWISVQLTFCGNIAFVVFWCENGTWYAGLKGAGFGFQAQAGGTCSSMTFHLTYGTDNTLCPGQSGAVTLTVTT